MKSQRKNPGGNGVRYPFSSPGFRWLAQSEALRSPVPIPNTEVKPSRAHGTARATAWESRSSPGLNFHSLFMTPSTAKRGAISCIVPMVSQ